MKKEMICISCPIGCHLVAERDDISNEVSITGNECRRGLEYGTEEMLSPSRVVTATVSISSATQRRAPVKSTKPVPRGLIDDLLVELYGMKLEAPIRIGHCVIENYDDSGIDIVATQTIGELT